MVFIEKENVVFLYYLTLWMIRCRWTPTQIGGGRNDKFWSSSSLSPLR